jgi:hypothetical protein
VIVKVVALIADRTFGVLLSVAGGEFHVAQPPAGTVRTVTGVEKLSVCVPSVSEDVVEKLAPGIAIFVVELVYWDVGVAIAVN